VGPARFVGRCSASRLSRPWIESDWSVCVFLDGARGVDDRETSEWKWRREATNEHGKTTGHQWAQGEDGKREKDWEEMQPGTRAAKNMLGVVRIVRRTCPANLYGKLEPNGLCSPAGIRCLKLHGLGLHPTHPLHQLKPKMSKRVKIADRKPGEWSCFPTFGLLNDLHEDSKVYAVETWPAAPGPCPRVTGVGNASRRPLWPWVYKEKKAGSVFTTTTGGGDSGESTSWNASGATGMVRQPPLPKSIPLQLAKVSSTT